MDAARKAKALHTGLGQYGKAAGGGAAGGGAAAKILGGRGRGRGRGR